jgi:flavin-dependent dehydrogenase
MPSGAPFSIAVIGAGLGGLVLARVLYSNCTVASCGQGGSLDTHPESGQYALQIAYGVVSHSDMSRGRKN